MDYQEFLLNKKLAADTTGFDIDESRLNPMLKPFQRVVTVWNLKKGRAAMLQDCGLGKTPQQLEWAQKVVEHTNGRVLIVTPLSVSYQTEKEAAKFGIEAHRSNDGKPKGRITITNYERLHLFDPNDWIGFVGDEASIMKNFNGATRLIVNEFMKGKQYRLLCTATAAPNDYIELGTLAEALGAMGYMDMLSRFFRNTQNTCDSHGRAFGNKVQWRFKKHAEIAFWKWVCSWARTLRKPSDLGFNDDGYDLPPLIELETVIPVSRPLNGKMFPEPARDLREQREERRATIKERCECAAEKVKDDKVAVVWCHLNEEGDYLEKIIPGAVQIKGAHSPEQKEERFKAFSENEVRVLVIKPKIGAFGLNWQHCNHSVTFPSHSYEQYYQEVRRFWRYGQEKPVVIDMIISQGEVRVLENLQRKAKQADAMFDNLVRFMKDAMAIDTVKTYTEQMEVPSWL